MKPALLALVVGIMLVTAAIAGAATSRPVHWPAGCVKFTCVNNHLNALHRRVHDANMRAMTPGPAGATGATGAQGPQGDSGAIGPVGPMGSTGPQGETGAVGDIGPAGDKGDTGDIGPIGPQGDTGDIGPIGPKGDTGDIGPIGPKGDTGEAAVYTAAGTLQAGSHIVFGSGTTNGPGNLTVTLTGSAAFTSGTSYVCTASYQSNAGGTLSPVISSPTATGFTIKGDASKTVVFICVGN